MTLAKRELVLLLARCCSRFAVRSVAMTGLHSMAGRLTETRLQHLQYTKRDE